MSAASLTRRSISLLRRVAQLQAEREVVAHGHVRVERVALEDHRDVAVLGRDVVHDPLADPQRAAGDVLEPGDHPQAGRLAAARRADEDHELAVADLEVQVVDRLDLAVQLAHVIEGDCGHRSLPLVRPMSSAAGAAGTIRAAAGLVRDCPAC